MKKFVVKLNLNRKSVLMKIEFGRQVETAMTGNPNFTTPSPTLPIIKTATDDLEAAYNAAQGAGPLQTALMYEKEAEWDVLMTALGNYVDNIAKGSDTIILSAAMETKRQSTPVGVPARVINVTATSVLSGELLVKWKPVYGAKAYLGYLVDEDSPLKTVVLSIKVTRGHAIINGLRSGGKYSVTIEAIGAGGVSGMSDKATSVVL